MWSSKQDVEVVFNVEYPLNMKRLTVIMYQIESGRTRPSNRKKSLEIASSTSAT